MPSSIGIARVRAASWSSEPTIGCVAPLQARARDTRSLLGAMPWRTCAASLAAATGWPGFAADPGERSCAIPAISWSVSSRFMRKRLAVSNVTPVCWQ